MDWMGWLESWGLARSWDWQLALAPRLVAAAVLGGLIGLEREVSGRSAGLRTQMLVAMGAALTMTVSLHFAEIFGQGDVAEAIRVDPARVAYGVMAGVGFLGAGAIIQRGAGVRGLTTAASLWCTAAVGLACGFGMYLLAGLTTTLVLFALVILRLLDHILPQALNRKLTIRVRTEGGGLIDRFRNLLDARHMQITNIQIRRLPAKGITQLTFHLRLRTPAKQEELLRLVAAMDDVMAVEMA